MDQRERIHSLRIQFENVDFSSRSGPNGFGLKLARQLLQMGHEIVSDRQDVRLTFIQGANSFKPNVLRLDGIYFNSAQDWSAMNAPIRRSYDFCSDVIVQSEFNKNLTQKYFGQKDNIHVVHNGTDFSAIEQIPPAFLGNGVTRDQVWMCASAWRPHKRLNENIQLFQRHAGPDDILLVAGSGATTDVRDGRVKIVGDLSWNQLISCMKSSRRFIHLAWLDHCPNVVVDANACGCQVICSSAGGTKEVSGKNSLIVQESEWDYEPTELYNPPKIASFDLIKNVFSVESVSIVDTALQYSKILEGVL